MKAAEAVDKSNTEALAAALKAVSDAENTLVEIVEANKAIASAKKVTNDGYTSSAWTIFQSAISTVENLIANDASLTQERLAAEVLKIDAAKNALVKNASADKIGQLAGLYQKYNGKDGDYTEASYAAMRTALAEASQVLANQNDVVDSVVTDAINKILNIEKALVKKASAEQVKQLTDLYNKYINKDSLYKSTSFAAMKVILAEIDALLKDTSNLSEDTARAAIEKALQAEGALDLIPVVTSVKMSVSKKTLGVKEKYNLKLKVNPSNADAGKLTWKTSKKSVATVDFKGKVTAKKTGKATITVTTKTGKKATCKITVMKAPSKVTLSAKKKTLKVKKTLTLTTKLPKGTAGAVTYSSSNKKIATVDAKGKVKGIKKGKVTIKAKTYNGKKASIKLEVKK